MRRHTLVLSCAVAAMAAVPALAHEPYLAPTAFSTTREFVMVEGAMTNETLTPDRPIRQGEYIAVSPAGEVVKLGEGITLKDRNMVEAPLTQEGTWKISTGDRAGRASKWAKIDGAWRSVRTAAAPQGGMGGGAPQAPRPAAPPADPATALIDAAAVPAGAEVIDSVSVLKSETYVSRGAPSKGALKPTGQGFELSPQTHPNEIFVGDAFKFTLLDDGKPVSGVEFSIVRGGDIYAAKRFAYAGKTDANGAAAVTFTDPGVYLLETSYPLRAEGAPPSARSTVYSLTFEVTR